MIAFNGWGGIRILSPTNTIPGIKFKNMAKSKKIGTRSTIDLENETVCRNGEINLDSYTPKQDTLESQKCDIQVNPAL